MGDVVSPELRRYEGVRNRRRALRGRAWRLAALLVGAGILVALVRLVEVGVVEVLALVGTAGPAPRPDLGLLAIPFAAAVGVVAVGSVVARARVPGGRGLRAHRRERIPVTDTAHAELLGR